MNKRLFDILHRNLNVQDVHFLEASAGTGKTFAIEHLVTRLILESCLSIDKILVVTFTRAATRELKMRIRSTLLRTKEMLREVNGDIDYLLAIQEKGDEALDAALKKIDAALICFDTAQIFTLHGFCHRMLSEFSFECKIAGALPSPERASPVSHYKATVQDYLLQRLSPQHYSPEQIKIVLKLAKNDPFRLMGKIVSLLSTEADIASYPPLDQLHAAFVSKLSGFPSICLDRLLDDFHRLKTCFKGMASSAYLEQVGVLSAIIQEKACSMASFERLLAEKDWFLDQMRKNNLKVKCALPSESSLHYPGIFDRMRDTLLPVLKEAGSAVKILLRLAKDCQAHGSHFSAQPECLSPDQMLRRLDEALETPAFLETIRKRFKAAIIDEFQDTDPIQWKIFERVFLGHLETICLVGDPKQSIYAFRNADIYTYLEAARIVGKENHKYLDTNFRSAAGLIDALNCVFGAPQGKGWIDLPRIELSMPVDPVRAGSKAQDLCHLVSRGAIHFFIGQADRGRSAQWPSKFTEENHLFPFIASEIWALRKKRDLAWEDIVILVKDRFQAQRLLACLKQSAIPCSFRRGENICTTDALSGFKECLAAVLSPSDLSTLKIALAGALMGWDEQLLSGQFDSLPLQNAKIHMQFLQNILYKKGFGPFFCAFLEKACPPDSHSIAEKLLKRKDLNLYQNLRKLSEILIEEEILRKLQGSDFLHFLEEIEKQSEEQEQRFETAPQEAKGSVALMTIHLSKGLEFDTVFALALACRHKIKEDEAVKKGPERMLVAFDKEHPECREAIEEVDAEKMRSLYVAMTRAKQQLYIPYVIDENSKPLSKGDASPIELFLAKVSKECASSEELYEAISRLQPQSVEKILYSLSVCCSLTYAYMDPYPVDEASKNCEKEPTLLLPSNLSLFVPDPIGLFSFSSLAAQSKHVNGDAILLSENSNPRDSLPLGSATGIAVHRIFECVFKGSLHHPLNTKKIEDLISFESETSPLAPFKKELCKIVIDHLTLVLLKNSLRLQDVPSSQLYQELEFLFPVKDKGMMKGFADLIFLYEDKYYLLDWKTNYLGPSLEDYNTPNMTQAMHMHQYFLQASIYAAALQRYVKLFDNRPFEEIFGGAFYIFVRGNGVFHFFPKPYQEV